MVSISHERSEEVERRLRRVIKQSRLAVYDALHAFEKFALAEFAERATTPCGASSHHAVRTRPSCSRCGAFTSPPGPTTRASWDGWPRI